MKWFKSRLYFLNKFGQYYYYNFKFRLKNIDKYGLIKTLFLSPITLLFIAYKCAQLDLNELYFKFQTSFDSDYNSQLVRP